MLESTPLGQLALLLVGTILGLVVNSRWVSCVVVVLCGVMPFVGYGFTDWFC